MKLIEQIRSVSSSTRVALESGLQRDENGDPISEGSCLHASVLLASVINRYCMGSAVVCGGGDGVAGARDVHGILRGHYWLRVTLSDGSVVIVDITGDQFGHEPVRVLSLSDARPLFVAGDQRLANAAARTIGGHFELLDLLRF